MIWWLLKFLARLLGALFVVVVAVLAFLFWNPRVFNGSWAEILDLWAFIKGDYSD